jgi:hypothetical protein
MTLRAIPYAQAWATRLLLPVFPSLVQPGLVLCLCHKVGVDTVGLRLGLTEGQILVLCLADGDLLAIDSGNEATNLLVSGTALVIEDGQRPFLELGTCG